MLISNNFFSLTKDLFTYKTYSQYRKYIKSNLGKCQIEDLTDFKLLNKRVRNNIIYFIIIISMDLNELKAYIIIIIKLTSKLNTLLIIFKENKALINN